MTVYGVDSHRRVWTAPRLTSPARTGRWGSAQVVAGELIAMLLAAALLLPIGPLLAVGLALLLAPALLRWRGRWWYEVGHDRLRLRRRRLRAGAPSIRTLSHEGADIGMGVDEDGWFAALAVTPPGGDVGGSRTPRLDALVRHAGSRIGLQVLVHHPMTATNVDPDSLCATSYEELRSSLGLAPPAEVLIVVRRRPRDARAGADQDLTAGRALRSALGRLGAGLRAHGFTHRVLDGPELAGALHRSLRGPDAAMTGGPPRESWRRWRTGRFAHVSFGATRWPARVPPDLLADLGRVCGAVEVWSSLVIGEIPAPDRARGPDGARLVVRVVAPAEGIGEAAQRLRAHARALGVSLIRLDGEQGPAAYATAPTAAPYGWGSSW